MTAPGTTPETDVRAAAARTDALLLDVREQDEWDAGHAPGAMHLPLSTLTLTDVPTDRPIVAVCRSGNRSGQLTRALLAADVDVDVVNMAGGMLAWHEAGLPMQSTDGSAATVLSWRSGPSRSSRAWSSGSWAAGSTTGCARRPAPVSRGRSSSSASGRAATCGTTRRR